MRRATRKDIIQAAEVLEHVRHPRKVRMPQELKRDVERIRSWWSDNIVGYAVGPRVREKAGKTGKSPVLRIYVHRKVHPSRVPKHERIPRKLVLDYLQAEVPIDVRGVDGRPRLNFDLSAGDEIGHFSGEAGTVGLFVGLSGDPGPFVLSCAHVLAPPPNAKAEDAIESPVDSDSTRALNQVAELDDDDHFAHLRTGRANPFDAALGRVDDGIGASNQIEGVDQPLSLLTETEDLSGVSVVQFGHVTGKLVQGTIGQDQHCSIDFGFRGGTYTIANLVRYTIENRPGDSGAAVIEEATGRVLGIHVGSEDGSDTAYFSPMPLIVDAFGIDPNLP